MQAAPESSIRKCLAAKAVMAAAKGEAPRFALFAGETFDLQIDADRDRLAELLLAADPSLGWFT